MPRLRRPRPAVNSLRGAALENPGVVFVYSGQGPQWLGMGRELFDREPAFREAIENIDAILSGFAHWSLREVLISDVAPGRLASTEFAQPAIFALQVGLTALWRSWGVVPEAVIGHSMGEVAGAHAAGVLSLEDAVRVIFHRSRLMQRATGQGKMAAVGISADEARRLIAGRERSLSIAALNSPIATVLSGDTAVLAEVSRTLELRGGFVRLLDVDYAFSQRPDGSVLRRAGGGPPRDRAAAVRDPIDFHRHRACLRQATISVPTTGPGIFAAPCCSARGSSACCRKAARYSWRSRRNRCSDRTFPNVSRPRA